ncbi:MAG: hypothetical protein AAGD23_10045 [Pseudomonadota bacterium]
MDLPFSGGGMLVLVALLLGALALLSVFRLLGVSRPRAGESEADQVVRTERAELERARIGFIALAIVLVLACASVFYVLNKFL